MMTIVQHTAFCEDVAFLNHVSPPGSSVSLSSNGSLLAVGGPGGVGATWVFQYDELSGGYRQLGEKLVGTGGDVLQGK